MRVPLVNSLGRAPFILQRVRADVGGLLVLQEPRHPAGAASTQRRLHQTARLHAPTLERHIDLLLRLDGDLAIRHARRAASIGPGQAQRSRPWLVASLRAGCAQPLILERHAAAEERTANGITVECNAQRACPGHTGGHGRRGTAGALLAILDAVAEPRRRQPLARLACRIKEHCLDAACRGPLRCRQEQHDVILPRGMGDRAVRRQLEVQHIAGHLASRGPILPGHRHRGAPVQRDTLERLAILRVVEVDITRGHPLERAASPFHARAAAQLDEGDGILVRCQARIGGAGHEPLLAAQHVHLAAERQGILDAVDDGGTRVEVEHHGIRVIRHLDACVFGQREHIVGLVVGHADAGAVHAPLLEGNLTRRAHDAVGLVEGCVLGMQLEAVAGLELHVARELERLPVLAGLGFLGHQHEVAALAPPYRNRHTEQLARAVLVEELPFRLDIEIPPDAALLLDLRAHALDRGRRIHALGRRNRDHFFTRADGSVHKDGPGDPHDRHDNAGPFLPSHARTTGYQAGPAKFGPRATIARWRIRSIDGPIWLPAPSATLASHPPCGERTPPSRYLIAASRYGGIEMTGTGAAALDTYGSRPRT